jgi:succinate-acetate transporter protein
MAEQQGTWGDPTPVALFAGGAGTTAVWALMTGRVGLQDMHIFIVWLAAVGVVQVITGLIHLKRGDPVGGSLNLAFGALFWCAPAMTLASLIWGGQPMAAMGIKGMPGLTINGWIFLILGIILCAFIPIMARQSWLSMIDLAIFAVAIFLLALLNLQPFQQQSVGAWRAVGQIAGWLIGLAGLVMVYLGMAISLLYGLGRKVLPIPGPLGGGVSAPGHSEKQ